MKVLISVMNGLNRFSQSDMSHPFDMSGLEDYDVDWSPTISDQERESSTLFYEVLKARPPKGSQLLFNRGTLLNLSESYLEHKLQTSSLWHDESTCKIFIGKSYGVVDTLRALKRFKRLPKINLMILIDGYATPLPLRSVTKRKNGKRLWFEIPDQVQSSHCLVQRKDDIRGLFAFNSINTIITPTMVKNRAYSEYKDGYKRELTVSHYNMEEIVSTIRCFNHNGKDYNLRGLLSYWFNH